MALTLEEFKELDRLTVNAGLSDELMAKVLPYYNLIHDASRVLREVDLSEVPPALVYRAGSVK